MKYEFKKRHDGRYNVWCLFPASYLSQEYLNSMTKIRDEWRNRMLEITPIWQTIHVLDQLNGQAYEYYKECGAILIEA